MDRFRKSLAVLDYYEILEKITSKAKLPLSKKKIRELRPERDSNAVNLLKETEEAVELTRQSVLDFSVFETVIEDVKYAKKGGTLSIVSILNISNLLRAINKIKKYFKNYNKKKRLDYLISEILLQENLQRKIEKIIISENEIHSDASSELKRIRKKIIDIEERLKKSIQDFINSTKGKKYLQGQGIYFSHVFRDGRICLPIKIEYINKVRGIIHDKSETGMTAFIEPEFVLERGNQIMNLKIAERKEIERILADLSSDIAEISDSLITAEKNIVKIDIIFARAIYSLEIKGVFPEILSDKSINIIEARHPLISTDEVQKVDITLNEKDAAMIISGPNTGGKTVILKTIGLFQLMLKIGVFIPCNEKSSLTIFKNIFVDIGDEQSIQSSLSTFSSHIKNINSIVQNAGENSLVLLDEIGTGTDPKEGSAIAISVIDYLIKKRVKVFATTHYGDLKKYGVINKNILSASVQFDVKTLMPTYKLLIGVPGGSNAIKIAEGLGVRKIILRKAREFVDDSNKNFENLLFEIQKEKFEIERELNDLGKRKIAFEKNENKLNEKIKKFENKKGKIISSAKEEAGMLLRQAKEELKEARKTAKEILEKTDEREIDREFEKANKKLNKTNLHDNKEFFNNENKVNLKEKLDYNTIPFDFNKVRVGDFIEIEEFDEIAEVLEIDMKKKELRLLIGDARMWYKA
ncbi:MAG: hypothetical protein LBD41_04815 [Clostridiales Family XIII bacterium]|jgi:DNA mismatch repair protein MutS2|nr:hypothetical protein [Clostridiales Family XIII bacterium]